MKRASAVPALLLAVQVAACQGSGEAGPPSGTWAAPVAITSESGQEMNPSLAPDGSAIAFDKLTAPGNADVYVVRPGQPPVNLTADFDGNDFQPAFSPDGRQIAFRSAREGGGIFVMGSEGGPARRVVAGGFTPAWSPDGREIVYGTGNPAASPYGAPATGSFLRAVDVSTGVTRQVHEMSQAYEPDVSPDGRRVAFWALGDFGASGSAQRDLWTVRIDGSELVRVTDDEAVDWSPTWSPDGAYLYFASDRDGAMKVWRVAIDQVTGRTAGGPELVTGDGGAQIRGHLSISADGKLTYMDREESRTLFAIPFERRTGVTGAAARISDPSVSPAAGVESPDGQWIAFTRGTAGQEDVFVMRTDGSGFRQLTNDAYRDRVPTWSPDGSRIAFRSDRPVAGGGRPYRWYQMNPDGSGVRLLLDDGAANIRWAPDGSRIATQMPGSADTPGAITLFDADGSNPRRFAGEGPLTVPFWSPDGRRFAYRETRASEQIIFVVDVTEGSGPRAVARSQGTLGNPVWAPDRRRIAYREVGSSGPATWVLDVSSAGAAPERLPQMDFNPLEWSSDGSLLMGTRPAEGGRPVAPVLYDFASRSYEVLLEGGAGALWLSDGSHVLVTTDAGTRLQIVDRATKTPRQLFSVTPPASFTFGVGPSERLVYYSVSEPEADIYQVTLRP